MFKQGKIEKVGCFEDIFKSGNLLNILTPATLQHDAEDNLSMNSREMHRRISVAVSDI